MVTFSYPETHIPGAMHLLGMSEVSGPTSLPVYGVDLSEDEIEPEEIGNVGTVFGAYLTEIMACPQRYDDGRGVWWPLVVRDRLIGELRQVGGRHAVHVTIAGNHITSLKYDAAT
jgi:hypothetical protein